MARQHALKDKLQDRFTLLKALRDEIRLDLHLANMELRDEWKVIETKLPDPARAASQLKGATSKTLDRLAGELKHFQSRIRRGGGADEPGVGRIMTRTAATCRASDTLAGALTAMWAADVGFLPVLGDDGAVLGVITDRDAAVAACTRGKRMDELPVEAVMTRDFASCAERDGIADALTIMRARRVRRLPVLDEKGHLAGVITLADAARAVAQGPDPAEVVMTLMAITEPSHPASAGN